MSYRTKDRAAELEVELEDERRKLAALERESRELRSQAWPRHKRVLASLRESWRTVAIAVAFLGVVGLMAVAWKYWETHPEPTHDVVPDASGDPVFRVKCHRKPGDWCRQEPAATCSAFPFWESVSFEEREWTTTDCTVTQVGDVQIPSCTTTDHYEGTMLYRCRPRIERRCERTDR